MPTIDITYKEFFTAPSIRRVKGVEIFTSGVHTDSHGTKKEWTKDEITQILVNFGNKLPAISPIKLGHTSPKHTKAVVEALGIPEPVLKGEGENSKGAATLGQVVGLSEKNNKLIAELDLPEKVAQLIDDKLFTGVSSELILDYQGKGPALGGLALLGVDRPAIAGLSNFNAVTITEDGTTPDHVYSKAFTWAKVPIQNSAENNIYSTLSDTVHTYHNNMLNSELMHKADELYSYSTYKYGILGKIFGSGKSDTIYHVPVAIEATDVKGKVSKRIVTVQHKRVSTGSEARGAVIRVLERVATQFGTVIARGAGEIIAKKIASGELKKWTIGKITKKDVKQAGAQETAEEILRKLKGKFTAPSHFISLKTAFIITSAIPVIADTLYKIFFKTKDGSSDSRDVYARSREEAILKARRNIQEDLIAMGSIGYTDAQMYPKLVDALYSAQSQA